MYLVFQCLLVRLEAPEPDSMSLMEKRHLETK